MEAVLSANEHEKRSEPRSLSPWPTAETSPAARFLAFPSALGWIGLTASGRGLHRLVFGHRTGEEARQSLGAVPGWSSPPDWLVELSARLQAYAEGKADDFADVPVVLAGSPFSQRVLAACRAIGYGETVSYGELATLAGATRAARAVGRVMATNAVPLVIPCHRVLAAGGDLRGFSALGGLTMKRRLLEMEQGENRPRIKGPIRRESRPR
jgi:methylated-DNA-[protein]-cysteine S-methyltransferase